MCQSTGRQVLDVTALIGMVGASLVELCDLHGAWEVASRAFHTCEKGQPLGMKVLHGKIKFIFYLFWQGKQIKWQAHKQARSDLSGDFDKTTK
jgi:hypothetical protein